MEVDIIRVSCSIIWWCDTKGVNMLCDTTQFPTLPCCGPYAKPHGVQGLIKHYNMQLYTKLVHGTCAV